MNFTTKDLRKGRREMEKSLTPAAKIRRQFAAGRPPNSNRWVDSPTAFRSLAARLHALGGAMAAEGLSERDLTAYAVTSELAPGADAITSTEIAVMPDRVPVVVEGKVMLIEAAEKIFSNRRCVVVGAVFEIVDREAKPEPIRRLWVTHFIGGQNAKQVMAEALEKTKGVNCAVVTETIETDPQQIVDLFIEQAKFSWVNFFLVLLDGSFWPPSTGRDKLLELVERVGAAGFCGVAQAGPKKSGKIPLAVMTRPIGNSENSEAALARVQEMLESELAGNKPTQADKFDA